MNGPPDAPEDGLPIHRTAAAFANVAASYERARPSYPAAVTALLRDQLGLAPGRRVLDVGAGTGKLTRILAETGADVVTVEPVAQMADQLRTALPGVEVLAGTAEALPLPDASVDAATVAQAFHWFDIPVALRELHRVLRPGGTLAIVFNRRALDTAAQATIEELLTPYRGDTPSWGDHRWERHLVAPVGFQPSGTTSRHRHQQSLPRSLAVERVASISFVAALDDATRRAVLDEADRRLAVTADDDGEVTLVHDAEVTFLVRDADGSHEPRGDATAASP